MRIFKYLLIISLLGCRTTNVYTIANGTFTIKIGKYSFQSEIYNRTYTGPYDTTKIRIPVPKHSDTLKVTNSLNQWITVIDTITQIDVQKYFGNISVNEIDSFLNNEVMLFDKKKKLKLDRMAVLIVRENGARFFDDFHSNKLSGSKPIVQFLKAAPANSYIVIRSVWLYKNSMYEQTSTSVAWKIKNSP